MLIISRRVGEKVLIGDDVVVSVVEVNGQTVRIGIDAPRSLPVYREELWAAIRDENRAAAATIPDELPPLPG
ncbi:carbon storage regulator CsrA [Patulibacter defluvii]|uniref:carbon storage regulator CsrA n=1 Tax=Patulibacter defluvii TaxID=3095358 RepID=UPI002A75707A|nr:carbon storage regulator CsrA [Patulibacter sp. DM4]